MMKTSKWENKKVIYSITLISMLILTIIFLNSFYWPYEELSKRKMLVAAIAVIFVAVIPVVVVKNIFLCECISRMIKNVEQAIEWLKVNKKKVLLYGGVILLGSVLAFTATRFLSKYILHKVFNMHLFYTIIVFGVLGLIVKIMWKSIANHPEKLYVVIALTVGIYAIAVTPARVGVSWDDEIHYARALEISNFLNGIMYDADEKNIADYATNIYGRTGYDRYSDYEYRQILEKSYDNKEWNAHEFNYYNVWSISYIPSALGIILARGLGLSYAGVFNMGRFFNLLMYICLIYCAMKKAKYGKVLIAAIGLIPTMIFMATSYSYDPWVVGFTILGFSYYFSELQEEGPIQTKNLLIIVGSIVLGCIPKAIYFPILFPLLFMPKRKFKNSKQRALYYLFIVAGGLLLVASFLLPMLISGPGTGDVRGGSAVNSTQQILFILKNPLAYLKILTEFELGYISIQNVGGMVQKFAYVGDGYFGGTICVILTALACFDRGEQEKNHYIIRGASLFGNMVAIVLATTALYISFTAVSSDTVAGMQGRYMLPTFYPALYALGITGVKHKINKTLFVCVPMLMIVFTFILNMFKLCVLYY